MQIVLLWELLFARSIASLFSPHDRTELKLAVDIYVQEQRCRRNAAVTCGEEIRCQVYKCEDVSLWDTRNVKNMSAVFLGLEKTDVIGDIIIGKWNMSRVTTMKKMFYEASDFNQDIGKWDTSKVTDMSNMFTSTNAFNQDVGKWDTSKVTDMSSMFNQADAFNQDVGKWNTSKVTDMSNMFTSTNAFNQDIGKWDTSKVRDMSFMFPLAVAFNQNIEKWDTSKVRDMYFMFHYAVAFNQNIGKWDTSQVMDMSGMFSQANLFGQDIGKWNTAQVTSMKMMFRSICSLDNRRIPGSVFKVLNIGKWNTSQVTTMERMFHQTTCWGSSQDGSASKQDLGKWDTSRVKNMGRMFEDSNFNHASIGDWDTSQVTNFESMLASTAFDHTSIGKWNTSKAIDFYKFLSYNRIFNHDSIGKWDTSQVRNMGGMFQGSKFNRASIGNWDTSKVTNFESVFSGDAAFNHDSIGKWDTSQVTSMDSMFQYNLVFNQASIGKWNVGNVINMRRMFQRSVFAANIEEWDTSQVTTMTRMFAGNIYFNQDIGKWNVGRVKDMSFMLTGLNGNNGLDSMFASSISFTGDLVMDDVNAILSGMILSEPAATFNQDIGRWDTSQVTDMSFMLAGATEFNQDLSSWDMQNLVGVGFQYAIAHTPMLQNNCTKDRMAYKWDRFGAFKVEYGSVHESWRTYECTPCPGGFVCTSQGAEKTWHKCSSGHWCPENTTSRSGERPCPSGKYSTNGTDRVSEATTCFLCNAGRYGSGTAKVGANEGCLPCLIGRTSAYGAPECYLVCTELGHYWDRTQNGCAPCPPGTALSTLGATESSECRACEAGLVAPANGTSKCTECDAGSYPNADSTRCLQCVDGSVSTAGDRRCTGCAAGTYADAARAKCAFCPPGRWSDTIEAYSIASCAPCPRGTFSGTKGISKATECNACSPGRSSNATGASASAACVECERGYYAGNSGQTVCETCTSGVSKRGSSYCTGCAAGMELDPTAKVCHPCPSGSVSRIGGKCVSCVAGMFEQGNMECVPCRAGTWSAVHGAWNESACELCPRGTFQSATGMDAADKCNACPPGKFGNASGSIAAEACKACQEGFFSRAGGQTSCESCVTGTSEPGSSYCRNCKAGTALNTSTVPFTCQDCPAGTTSGNGDPRCITCRPGTYANTARTKCELCPAGTWSAMTGASSSATCTPCIPGTFSGSGVDSSDGCNACPPGTSSSAVGANSSKACAACEAGEFSQGGQSSCSVCYTGTSATGSSYCTECNAGRELNATTTPPSCTLCSLGTASVTGRPCARCEKGRYANVPGSETCTRCPDFMTTLDNDASRCVAAVGYVQEEVWISHKNIYSTHHNMDIMHKCPLPGTTCNATAGMRLETLELVQGFWRPSYTSFDVRPCKAGSGCIGGVSFGAEGEGVCSNATTGPYCAVCTEGFKRHINKCVACEELGGSAATPLLVLLGVAVALAIIWLVLRKRVQKMWTEQSAKGVMLVGMTESSDNGGHGRVVEKFKIAYTFAQVVSSTVEEFAVKFPPVVSSLASVFSAANLDVFGFLSMGCLVDVNFYGELVTTCTVPLGVAAISAEYARRRGKSKTEKRSAAQIFTQVYLVVLFCVYSGTTRKVFTTFKCEGFVTAGLDDTACARKGYTWRDDGCYRSFLRADLSLSCDVDEYTGWRVFAVIMALVYPLGVPLLFLRLLRFNAEDPSISFIRAAYENRYYWWEIIELGRKLLLTLVLVFFYEGAASQILLTLIIAFGFFGLLRSYKPYKSDDDDFLAALAQALLVLTSLASLCLKVNVAEDDSWDSGWFDFFLTLILISVPALALFELFVAAGLLRRDFACARCKRDGRKSVAPILSDTATNELLEDVNTTPAPVVFI